MIHNQTASVVAMARSMQISLDRSSENTSVPTNTLDLLLSTLIEVAQQGNPMTQKIETQQVSALAERIKAFERK